MEQFPDWLRISIFGITQFIMLVGLFGLLVPFFPGIVVIWLAALGYGIVTGFHALPIVLMVLITLLMLAGVTADNVLMGAGARKGGASWLVITLSMVAGVVGTIIFPPFGGLIASPLSVLLLEFWRLRNLKKAGQAVIGMAAGYGLSFVARFAIGAGMMILWWVWVWKG